MHRYAQAILKAMRLRSATNASEVAIGLPDFPRYRNVVAETKESLSLLGIGLYFVRDDGRVGRYLDHVPRWTGA